MARIRLVFKTEWAGSSSIVCVREFEKPTHSKRALRDRIYRERRQIEKAYAPDKIVMIKEFPE